MKVRINTHGNPLPTKKGDWVDLYCAEDVVLKQFESKMISLGVSIEIPVGYEAHVLPRSSTFKNYGILMTNSMGVIDNAYKGDDDIWHFPAIAMRDTIIPAGERIAQFRIMKNTEEMEFEPVTFLNNRNRGGLGSTGRK